MCTLDAYFYYIVLIAIGVVTTVGVIAVFVVHTNKSGRRQ